MLVGEAGKKGYLRRLKTRAQHLNISARVVFCGAQHDIAAHLSAMDLFVHLPRDEAFGLAPAEAMSAGLPVLVSNVGGCVELVTDGETGLVTGATNRAEIRAKLAALIDSPDLRQRLAAAGSDYIQARFTPKAQADTLIDLYDRVLQVDAVTNSRG
jgi:glycosyltransferase involved in cell wall biosynthesis